MATMDAWTMMAQRLRNKATDVFDGVELHDAGRGQGDRGLRAPCPDRDVSFSSVRQSVGNVRIPERSQRQLLAQMRRGALSRAPSMGGSGDNHRTGYTGSCCPDSFEEVGDNRR